MEKWHHSPMHMPGAEGSYILTAATYRKEHIYAGHDRLELLQTTLLGELTDRDLSVQAWAIFPNHYHVVFNTETPVSMGDLVRDLHSSLARQVNSEDNQLGRQVWFQYWDTHLTFQRSYFARLRYVHTNPVRHGLVQRAGDYPFCSAAWFESTAEPSFVRTLETFKIDRLKISDDF
jgi:putative transposase